MISSADRQQKHSPKTEKKQIQKLSRVEHGKEEEGATYTSDGKKAKRRHSLKVVPQHFLPLTSPLI